MASLDYALVNFHTDISPWKSPVEWLDADTSQIINMIHVFAASTNSAEIENANFAGDMVYPVRSTAAIFKYVISKLVAASNCLHLCTPYVLHA
jgi:hypothetical protein